MSTSRHITVGVVVERRKAASQWIDFTWRPVSVLPGQPEAEPWTVLAAEEECTTFYAGTTTIDLYRTETGNYRDNLTAATPSVWIALRPIESDPPYKLLAATVDPAEGEAFTEAGSDLIEPVPMPDVIREAVAAYVAEHHVERQVFKRRRDRPNTEAMARRAVGRQEDDR